MRIILYTVISFLLGAYFATGLQNAPQLNARGQAWCYVSTVPNLKEVPTLEERLVDISTRGVDVYEPCN